MVQCVRMWVFSQPLVPILFNSHKICVSQAFHVFSMATHWKVVYMNFSLYVFSMGFILSWTMWTLTPLYNWIEFSSVELKPLAKMFVAAYSLGSSQWTIYKHEECSKLCKKFTWTTQSGRSFYYYKLFCNTWTGKNTMI